MSTTTRARLVKRLGLATAVAASMMAVVAGSASAAALPTGANNVTFNSSPGGWSSNVSYGGLCLIPAVTCAAGSGDWISTGGSGTVQPNGHVQSGFGALVGALSNTTITWSSPSFKIDPKWNTVVAKYKVRGHLASLLNLGGRAQFRFRLTDLSDASRSFDAVTARDLHDRPDYKKASATVPLAKVHNGDTYRIDVITHFTAPVATVPVSSDVDYDEVHLKLSL
jgi:hypothetical protein